jgi:Ca-activated chloride channel family protein
VGVGTTGMAPYPVQTPYGIQLQNVKVDIDEPLLKEVSRLTDGRYFRATNNVKLRQIYQEIDKLEKSKIDVTEFRKKKEEYLLLALAAFIFIALEILLRNTVFKNIP